MRANFINHYTVKFRNVMHYKNWVFNMPTSSSSHLVTVNVYQGMQGCKLRVQVHRLIYNMHSKLPTYVGMHDLSCMHHWSVCKCLNETHDKLETLRHHKPLICSIEGVLACTFRDCYHCQTHNEQPLQLPISQWQAFFKKIPGSKSRSGLPPKSNELLHGLYRMCSI